MIGIIIGTIIRHNNRKALILQKEKYPSSHMDDMINMAYNMEYANNYHPYIALCGEYYGNMAEMYLKCILI